MKKLINILSIAALCTLTINADHKKHSHKVQILLDKEASWFKYGAILNGDPTGLFTNNPFAPRSLGSPVYINGLIYPKGTVDVDTQTSFLEDKDGNPLTEENSVGEWYSNGTQLVDFDFFTPVAIGTLIEQAVWAFNFNKDEDDTNLLFGETFTQVINNFGQANPFQLARGSMLKGYGENDKIDHMNVKAKAYLAPNGDALIIKVRFSEKIEYNS